jgi:hypothetical protein
MLKEMKIRIAIPAFCAALLLGTAVTAGAQNAGVYAYPNGGQSAEQQKRDYAECTQWATTQTGFDPARNRPPQTTSYSTRSSSSGGGALFDYGSGEIGQGGVAGDAARGAATGALLGAIAGDAGAGAAWGAAGGAIFGGMKRSNRQYEEDQWRRQQQAQAQQQQAQAQQQYQYMLSAYQRAYGACMTARNYRVQ